jgi:hypothetical protein
MKKLFLDDIREPWDRTWDVVRSYDAFMKYIEQYGVPDVIAFDHDLEHAHYVACNTGIGVELVERTGLTCAEWLIKHIVMNGLTMPSIVIVHSWNAAGARKIAKLFEDVSPTLRFPYPCTPLKALIERL